mmetsp:Transcript_57350/g.139905  ORF Transcript_57350/g.139905 Transcript_57350/m.139905 type:complete len:126 (-) Transcript_57350:1477-1854(-)
MLHTNTPITTRVRISRYKHTSNVKKASTPKEELPCRVSVRKNKTNVGKSRHSTVDFSRSKITLQAVARERTHMMAVAPVPFSHTFSSYHASSSHAERCKGWVMKGNPTLILQLIVVLSSIIKKST